MCSGLDRYMVWSVGMYIYGDRIVSIQIYTLNLQILVVVNFLSVFRNFRNLNPLEICSTVLVFSLPGYRSRELLRYPRWWLPWTAG